MDNQLLVQVIKSYLKHRKENPTVHAQEEESRKEKSVFYQSFGKDRILQMSVEEYYQYHGNLWSMLMWGNKQYAIDNILKDNGGIENIRHKLVELIFSSEDIVIRWDRFLKEVKGIGPAAISELLSHYYPDRYAIFNGQTVKCLNYLGVEGLPKYNHQYTGMQYKRVCNLSQEILKVFLANGLNSEADLLTVDYILWDEILPLIEQEPKPAKIVTRPGQVENNQSLHDEIQVKLVEIGRLLGFTSRPEIQVAVGAVVDVVWEAQIGNMGKAIYVFEVQTKGSIDSLVLNLKKSQQNAAVQAIVAVSDEAQIEKIIKESKGVIDHDTLKTWELDEVNEVHDALSRAHESINKLGLVPDSFLG